MSGLRGIISMSQASRSPATAPAASPETRIKKLEQQLSIVTAERNDLAADVEALCMQSSGDIFSASSVLGDRISHIQKEANKLQCQVHLCAYLAMPSHCTAGVCLLLDTSHVVKSAARSLQQCSESRQTVLLHCSWMRLQRSATACTRTS